MAPPGAPPAARPGRRSGPRLSPWRGCGAEWSSWTTSTRPSTALGRGSGRLIVVEGEPGIGKSTLLAHLADRADAAGFALRAGRGDELGQGRPFGPLAKALGLRPDSDDPAAARIGRELRGDDGLDHDGLPMAGEVAFRVLDTVLALIDDETARHPLALIIDDAHWADDDTLRVVAALAERARTLPIVVAIGTRGHPQGPVLASCIRAMADHGADHIELGALAPAPMAEVVADLVGGTPGPALRADVGRAGGNPFLAIELVTAHSAVGRLRSSGGTVELDGEDDPADLGSAVLRRLDHLRPQTVEFLRAASVFGRTFDPAIVSPLVDRRGIELATDVDEAVAAGLLHAAGDSLSFSHDLVREAIYTALPPSARAAMHVEAARALAATDAEAFDIATQVQRTTGTGGDDAVAWLVAGAQQVRVTAPTTAASFLAWATEILGPSDPERPGVEARLAEAKVFSGQLQEGQALTELCLARPDLDDDLRRSLIYLLGQALFLQGRLSEAARHFEQSAGAGPDPHPAALADGAVALLLSGDLRGAADLADRAGVLARQTDDVATEVFVLAAMSWIRALQGDIEDGLDFGRRAASRADVAGDLEAHRNIPYVFYAQVLLWADRDAEALDALDKADRLGERLGLVWDVPLRHLLRARARQRTGDGDEATAEARAGLSHSRDQGGSVADVWLWCVLARLAIARGHLDEGETSLVAAEAAAGLSGQGTDQIAWARGLLAEAQGDARTAADHLALLWDGLEEQGLDYYLWDVAPDMIRVAVGVDDRDRTARVLSVLAEVASRSPGSLAPAVEARCRGLANRDPDAVLLALRRIESRSGAARPVESALVRLEAAALLDAVGRTDEAAAQRAAADPVIRAAGVAPPRLPGRAEPETDATPGPRDTFGWDSLTARELEVLTLLAGSRSNAQIAEELFCSRRTVESHLSHVYTKLGISSRVELAMEASRRLDRDP